MNLGEKRSFNRLLVMQFFTAFDDHAFKMLFIMLAIRWIPNEKTQNMVIASAPGLFVLPFLLFSIVAGSVVDRSSKKKVLEAFKLAEFGILAVGLVGVFTRNFPVMYLALFAIAAQSAFISPAKNGIIPEILPREDLSHANGLMTLGTFLALLLGTAVGSLLGIGVAEALGSELLAVEETASSSLPPAVRDLLVRLSPFLMVMVFSANALIGWLAARKLPGTPAHDPGRHINLNPFLGLGTNLKILRGHSLLLFTTIGILFFWFVGVVVQTLALIQGKEIAHWLMVILAVGIGSGAFFAGRISGKKIELALIPLGVFGIVIFTLILAVFGGNTLVLAVALGILAFFAGIITTPLSALPQEQSLPAERGRVLATISWLANACVVLTTLGMMSMTRTEEVPFRRLYLITAGVALVFGLYAFIRCFHWVLWVVGARFLRLRYRILTVGKENLPDRGPLMLIPNHVSYIDGFFVGAALQRPVRYLVHRMYFTLPLAGWFLRKIGAIPIGVEDRPRELLAGLNEAKRALEEGEPVCIFPEARMSRTGNLLPFRKGYARVLDGLDVPVIPVYLDGVWGSIWSFERERYIWKVPKGFPRRRTIHVCFGTPLSPTAEPHEVRQGVSEAGARVWKVREKYRRPVMESFLRMLRKQPGSLALVDTTGKKIQRGDLVLRSVGLARKLNRLLPDGEPVGVLLPTGVAAALTNYALRLTGRVTINLNYSGNGKLVREHANQAKIRTIIGSRAFSKRIPPPWGFDMIYLEDLAEEKIGLREKLAILLHARVLPVGWTGKKLRQGRPSGAQDPAFMLATSGSTGKSKIVVLSEGNIGYQMEALQQALPYFEKPAMVGVLPIFHAFGLTATILLPPVAGFPSLLAPDPFDTEGIGKIVREYGGKIIVATPSLLGLYAARIPAENFAPLELVVAGAEKLRFSVREVFRKAFGKEIYEGYGATELAPVVSFNRFDRNDNGVIQIGNREGTVGHPLPGTFVKIVGLETGEVLPPGKEGKVFVKSPGVMLGYLGQKDKTDEVLRDGWYDTGDLGRLDEDGFLEITGRLSRFSKIAGEMVPHGTVEDTIQDWLNESEPVCGVTAIPDEKKGERLVVVFRKGAFVPRDAQAALRDQGLPNLWVPDREAFVEVEEIPMLPTGKRDLAGLREIALEVLGKASE